MEPISRIPAARTGLDPITAAKPPARVERDDPRPDDERRRRRRRPPAPEPAQGGVQRDADGRPHVDVQA